MEKMSQIMADDAVFVIGFLNELNDGIRNSIFYGRLNLDELGMIGHSLGGAAAYNLAINDSRIKAAINLDGSVLTMPMHDAQPAPFLMMANDQGVAEMIVSRESLMPRLEDMSEAERNMILEIYGNEAAYAADYQKMQPYSNGLADVLAASETLFCIEGSSHASYTDFELFFGSRQLRELTGLGKTKPEKSLEITRAVTLAFFDRYVKGKETESLESLVDRYAELKRVDVK
jgi:pimeloyl-ACP methyl ester carboxylesterase